jgi:hypothetical protein
MPDVLISGGGQEGISTLNNDLTGNVMAAGLMSLGILPPIPCTMEN